MEIPYSSFASLLTLCVWRDLGSRSLQAQASMTRGPGGRGTLHIARLQLLSTGRRCARRARAIAQCGSPSPSMLSIGIVLAGPITMPCRSPLIDNNGIRTRWGLSSAFTPQVVVDGRSSFVGSDKRRILAAVIEPSGHYPDRAPRFAG